MVALKRSAYTAATWIIPVLWSSALLFFCVGMPSMFGAPIGTHFIRQTDSLAFVVHFREFTAGLLSPGVLDLKIAPDSGASAGEFPIFYWFIAWVERLLGPMPNAMRWLSGGSVIIAHASLIRTLSATWNDRVSAYGLITLFSGSSILAFYGFNFLPDAAVYGMVVSGWSLALPDMLKGRPTFSWASLILFVLAAAIKAPTAIHLIAWSVILLVSRILKRGRPTALQVGGIVLGASLITAWHMYARWYNAAHGSNYFMTWAEPIWTMSTVERGQVLDLIWNYWWTKYLHPSAWHLFIALMFILLIRWGKVVWSMKLLLGLSMAGSTGFILLFFRKFADHDYYFITVLPTMILIAVTAWRSLIDHAMHKWVRLGAKCVIGMVALASLILARTEVMRRTTAMPRDHARVAPYLADIREAIRPLDLPLRSKIIVLGDSSANGALTSIGRMGWTYPGYPVAQAPTVQALMERGATHLLAIRQEVPHLTGTTLIEHGKDWSLWRLTR